VALVFKGSFGDLAGAHREQRLAAVKHLYLIPFIDTQHDSVRWRCNIQPGDIAHLVDKAQIGRQFEPALAVG
jgi:hypothetical protein